MSSNEKVGNVLGDRKEEVFTTPFSKNKSSTKGVEKGADELEDMLFMEKKYSTKYVDKGTGELEDMKQAVNAIRRKGIDQFEVQYIGSKGRFKLYIEFFKTAFSKTHSESRHGSL